jgi:type IV secretion system protein VirB6
LLAKIALAIFLGVGPIFVLLTQFEATKRFFDSWLGQVLNYVFVVMLTACAVKLIMTIIQTYMMSSAVTNGLTDPSIAAAIPAILYSIIGVLVLLQVPSMASSLGGGAAISTLGAVGAVMGGAAASAAVGARGAKAGARAIKDRVSGKTKNDKITAARQKQSNDRWLAANPDALKSGASKRAKSANSVARG